MEVNPKIIDNLRFPKSWMGLAPSTKTRKTYFLVGLLVTIVLVASGIIVPLTIYALNDTESSAVPTTTITAATTTVETTMTTQTIPTTKTTISPTPSTTTSTTCTSTPKSSEKRCMYFCEMFDYVPNTALSRN